MPILVSAHQLKKGFGARPLFDGVTFSIESNERIGLIGPNGAGKSTLLRLIAQQTDPDTGTLSFQRGLRVGFLEQVPTFKEGATIFATVMEGAKSADARQDPMVQARASELLSRLSLSDAEGIGPETPVNQLSGGWKKRVALARELLQEPDLLLLDEPTNHLDVESIEWLEEFLENAPFAALTITHDRLFLQRVATRILELDRRNPGGLLSISGDYATYIEIKESMMAAQERQEVRLKNTLRRETEWLRRGAKARTTKQQARIQRHGELKEVVDELGYRNQTQSVRLDFQGAEKNPKKLLEARGISKKYGDKVIVPPTDLLITPKSRIGLLGVNGCGKSTLIRLLLGDETSDTGEIIRSDQLKPIYFEQNRESLDPEESVLRTLCPTGDFVSFRGNRTHVKSYLDRFLFTAPQMEMAVGKLSGGEQSRLLIARLMLEESNLLVLDEPTNDLDLATLTVLEEVLQDFPGAVILVTHDRYFLDQVARRILAFGENPKTREKEIVAFSGLDQWETWKRDNRKIASKAPPPAAASAGAPGDKKKRKLSYNEQRDLDGMEAALHKVETRLTELAMESVDPKIASNAKRLSELTDEMAKAQSEIERLYARWAELES